MCWSSKCHRNWSLARRKLKFYLISAVRSIEPLTKMFFDGVHLILDLFFVFEGSQHILTIADMIIARLLSPEICDTVSNFTSLTIKGFCVASSRCCNFCLVVHSLQPVSSLSFFFGNFLRKMEQRFLWMNCIHTCCRGETVIKLKEKKQFMQRKKQQKNMQNSENLSLISKCHSWEKSRMSTREAEYTQWIQSEWASAKKFNRHILIEMCEKNKENRVPQRND